MMHQRTESLQASAVSTGRWIVLRTAAPRTLILAQALLDAGYDVWTPTRMQKRRTLRGKTKTSEVEVPLMPTFVFARQDRQDDLQAVLRMPASPFPAFSIFHHMGKVAKVKNAEVERLRTEELRGKAKRKASGSAPLFAAGQPVRVENDTFRGLTGEVVLCDGSWTVVTFGGAFDFKIASMHLRTDQVQDRQPG
ncbi:transcription termination/antitermination NusG family protein [Sphingomonas sp. DC2300-3]|uniref:transcription termination/antitermination NusG family protein n=1 Tax=unclassified Sphingomonas TaxID=196159 RepID=UPI003CE881E4